MLLTFGYLHKAKNKRKAIDALILLLLFQGCMLCIYGFREYLYFFDLAKEHIRVSSETVMFRNYAVEIFERKRVFSLFLSPNLFAGYLISVFPLSLYFLIIKKEDGSKRRIAEKVISLVAIFLFTISILLTKSVGALFSVFILLIVFAILFPPREKHFFKVSGIVFSLVLLVMMCITIMSRNGDFFDNSSVGNSVIQRLHYWETSIRIITSNVLSGTGPGNFRFFYPRYKLPSANETRFAHNIFLQIFAENGILGILSIIFLYIVLCAYILKLYRDISTDTEDIPASILSGAGVLLFLIHNIVSFSFFYISTSFVFWIFLGIILSSDVTALFRINIKKYVFIVSLSVLIISCFCVGLDILMQTAGNFFYLKAESNINDFEKNAKLAVHINPFEPEYYIALAKYKSAKSPLESVRLFLKAADIVPSYYKTYEDIALIFARIGRDKEANAYMELSRLLYPSNNSTLPSEKPSSKQD